MSITILKAIQRAFLVTLLLVTVAACKDAPLTAQLGEPANPAQLPDIEGGD